MQSAPSTLSTRLISAFEASDSASILVLLPQIPDFLPLLDDQTISILFQHMKSFRDHEQVFNYSLLREDRMMRALCSVLVRQDRNLQIQAADAISLVCDAREYVGFAGSRWIREVLDVLQQGYNEDALLPLVQTIAGYQRVHLIEDFETIRLVLAGVRHILRDCSFERLLLETFDLLNAVLGDRSESLMKIACESDLIATLLIYIGNPNVEIKQRTMMTLTTFKDCPDAVEPLATQGIGNLMHALVSFPDSKMRKMTIDILTCIAQAKAEYRDSLIIHNFAPVVVSILTGTDQSIKLEALHLLSLVLNDKEKHQIDELVENNLISVLCRIVQREDALKAKALDCVEAILEAGGTDGMYKALLQECRITKLLLNMRTSAWGEQTDRILFKHFPKAVVYDPAQAAPFLQDFNHPRALGIQPPVQGNPVISVVQAPPAQIPNPKKRPNRHPKGTPAVVPAKKTGGKPALGKTGRMGASLRSGLVFPVPLITRRLRGLGFRVSRTSGVYLSAVLEYLTSEVLELAGEETRRRNRVRIQPADIQTRLRDDEELARLTQGVVLPETGNRTERREKE